MTAVCALLFCLAFASSAFASGPYCAIAYSPSTGRWGHGENYPNRASAEARALAECSTYDARVVVWVHHGYAALAVDNSHGRYGVGYAASLARAKRNAIRGCNSPNAHVVQSVWSGVY